MEHFWQNIEGNFTWPDFYAWLARTVRVGGKIVEVGVQHGQSAACLAVERACVAEVTRNFEDRLSDKHKIDLVDMFPNGTERVRKELAPVEDWIGEYHSGLSWSVAQRYVDRSLAAVFIDADHEEDSVRQDIAAWWPKVEPGGWLAGHDFCPPFPGVMNAVLERFKIVEVWRGDRWCGRHRNEPPGEYLPVWCVHKIEG